MDAETALFILIIGVNIGFVAGWIACKKFGGSVAKAIRWLDGNDR